MTEIEDFALKKNMVPGQLTGDELDERSAHELAEIELQAAYLADVCRDELPGGCYRASGSVTVTAAAESAAAGVPVPVSGDGFPRWLMARHR